MTTHATTSTAAATASPAGPTDLDASHACADPAASGTATPTATVKSPASAGAGSGAGSSSARARRRDQGPRPAALACSSEQDSSMPARGVGSLLARSHGAPRWGRSTKDSTATAARPSSGSATQGSGRAGGGRDMAALLHDFGHDLPTRPSQAPAAHKENLWPGLPYPRGHRGRGRGWAPSRLPLRQYRMTTDQAPVLWPLLTGPALPPYGALMGIDQVTGAAFYASPRDWVTDDSVPVSNTNVIVSGAPGRGKSGCTKAFLSRMIRFGYSAFINGDVKDEYEKLCHFYGVDPVVLGPGLPGRINPLEWGPLGADWDHLADEERRRRASILIGRWTSLVQGLVGSQKIGDVHVPFGPSDRNLVNALIQDLTGYTNGTRGLAPTTLPKLWHAVDNPTPELLEQLRYAGPRDYYDQTRLLRDSLSKLVHGELAGMFDQETNITVDWSAPIASISLSRLSALGNDAVGAGLMCMGSWRAGYRDLDTTHRPRINVSDECWYRMRMGTDAVKDMDAEMRLTRTATGDIEWMVLHKPGDFASAGDAGSQATTIAKELLHLADVHVLHGQDPEISGELADLLGLSPTVRSYVTGWANQARGRAVWMLGPRPYKVQTYLHPWERALTWTNDHLAAAPATSGRQQDEHAVSDHQQQEHPMVEEP